MYITLKLEDKLRFGYDILPLYLVLLKTDNSVVGLDNSAGKPWEVNSHIRTFLNPPVSHTNLFTVVRGELTVPEEALKV